MRGEKWTREEMILAFNLYLKLPFGKMQRGTPEIIELANLMGRLALYDKAFDKGLIGINGNYEVILSANLNKNRTKDYFVKYFAPIEKVKLQMPQKYLPKAEFLEWHRDIVFEK
ncbi:hypothetical protein AGMMS50239_34420 [Bacteroidia bacterium]|nr:hypothetical protein AGMMS50239_34420 [Bacteroidia bacterium]